MEQGGLMAFLYLGAKHMVTGYDHLLFLFGVIFFLYRLRDVGLYVTLFAVGHSVTLLYGVLSGTNANPFIVDAIIGFSVVYKAFDNLGGFTRLLRTPAGHAGGGADLRLLPRLRPGHEAAGLRACARRAGAEDRGLQSRRGSRAAAGPHRHPASRWASGGARRAFARQAFAANVIVMTCGFLLMGYQLAGYVGQRLRPLDACAPPSRPVGAVCR